MEVIEKHNLIIGGIVTAFTYIFGENWILFAIFLMLNIMDWITGIIKSRMAGKENSNKGLTGIVKKIGYWMMVVLGFAIGQWFVSIGSMIGVDLHVTTYFGWFVLASLTVNEFRSVLENFVEAGYNVPKILVEGLEVADKAFNKEAKEDK